MQFSGILKLSRLFRIAWAELEDSSNPDARAGTQVKQKPQRGDGTCKAVAQTAANSVNWQAD